MGMLDVGNGRAEFRSDFGSGCDATFYLNELR
jgi:hypothetical protein